MFKIFNDVKGTGTGYDHKNELYHILYEDDMEDFYHN